MSDNREFEIKGTTFQVNKIDAFKQFHVARRLAPLMAELLPILSKFSAMGEKELSEDQFSEFAPVVKVLGTMSDADSEYVLKGLLSAVAMKQAALGNYANVVVKDTLMFQDIDLVTMVQLAARALMYNMGNFITALPQTSTGQGQTQKGK